MDCVHCGWLTKSPPESRMKRVRPFKSQWRRRYFILYAPPRSTGLVTSSGHSAFLHYYDSEKITKKKGSIDLDSCEELRDRLDSNYYRHLFSLRTRDHGQSRTYYLAADTETEMDAWVDHLTRILDFSHAPMLTPTPTLLEPGFPVVTTSGAYSPTVHNTVSQRKTHMGTATNHHTCNFPSVSAAAAAKMTQSSATSVTTHKLLAPAVTSPPARPLNDKPPVLSPKAKDYAQNFGSNVLCRESQEDESLYNYPRVEELYNSPRPSYPRDMYDTPPLFTPSHPSNYNNDNGSYDDTYDLPPKSHRNDSDECNRDDVYDIPSSSGHVNNSKPAPPAHDLPHGYVNAPIVQKPANTDEESTDSGDGDDTQDYEVLVSSRTRSFRSSAIRYPPILGDDDNIKLPLSRPVMENDTEDEDDC